MRETTLGPLTVRVTGGADREGGGDGPVVVLMHGFGAPGDDLVPLWRVLDVPKETRFVFPEAPLELGGMGFGFGTARAWWMIDVERLERAIAAGETRDLSQEVPEGLPEARAKVTEMLAALHDDWKVAGERLVLGGFSQGSMLALDVALHVEQPLAGLVLMSSTLLAEHEWVPRMTARVGLPVVQSHGERDPLLPFSLAERLRDRLTEAGLKVDWVPFRGAHEIPPPVLERVGAFVRDTLADPL